MADLAPNPYLAPLCGDILMSDACQKINFYWAGMHVDGSGFSYVALALASGGMSLVHESTHAMQDAELSGKKVRGVDEEAAAFVAGALYIIYSGSSYSPAPGGAHPAFAIAQGIAQSISGNPGYAIDPTVMAPLRAAILADVTYQFLSTNPYYTEDGVSL
jgi:hypothetical protein